MAAGGQRPPGQGGMGFFSDAATSALGLALDGPQALAGKSKIDTLTATDNAKAQKLKPRWRSFDPYERERERDEVGQRGAATCDCTLTEVTHTRTTPEERLDGDKSSSTVP